MKWRRCSNCRRRRATPKPGQFCRECLRACAELNVEIMARAARKRSKQEHLTPRQSASKLAGARRKRQWQREPWTWTR